MKEINLARTWEDRLPHLNPVTPEGFHVALVRRTVFLIQNVVKVEAVHERLPAGVAAAVSDQVPGQHLLHHGDGFLLSRDVLHVLHQPEHRLRRQEGVGGQRRRLGNEG